MKTTNNKPLLTLACLVATATALPAAIISTTVFTDDFSSDTSANYTYTDTFNSGGSFTVSGGTLNVTASVANTADVFYNTAIFDIGQTVSVDLSGAKDTYLSVSTTTRAANTAGEDGIRFNWKLDGTFQVKNYTNGTPSTLGFDSAFDVDASSLTLYLHRASDNVFAAAFDDGSGFTWLNTTGGTERQDFTVGDTGNGALYIGVEAYNNTGVRNFDNLTLSVPEPSSTALLGLGGLALMLRRKR